MAEVQKQREAQRRRLQRANQTRKRPGTPEAVPGRKHMDIQTDSYLEKLTDRVVEFEAETQTDFILDRPPSPLFMPAKIGIDIETQIEDGELFDFDVECEPVLEVLVGKTLEQSMMEVLEEEELASLQRHQEDFEKRRNAELLEVQRMEAAEKRRADEVQRRVAQQAARHEQDICTMRKVLARQIASEHLQGLKGRLLQNLEDAGVFADVGSMAVETKFMPGLLQAVVQQIKNSAHEHALADAVISSSVESKPAPGHVAFCDSRSFCGSPRLSP
ncbi:RSP3 [Symbiodinium natans]|uniref:RSP3 protein n=1 Tax=Symbiodinium natans TaxID=878477 RepID=A0A812UE76_9DINO|nr:RSP3 [Symbiodinium natans]